MTDATLTEMYSRAAIPEEIDAGVAALAVVDSKTEGVSSEESSS